MEWNHNFFFFLCDLFILYLVFLVFPIFFCFIWLCLRFLWSIFLGGFCGKGGERQRGRATWGAIGRGEFLAQASPCKPMMVVEVCCHRHELLIARKVWCLHQVFLISFFLIFFAFIYLFLIYFLLSKFPFFFVGFFNAVFLPFKKKNLFFLVIYILVQIFLKFWFLFIVPFNLFLCCSFLVSFFFPLFFLLVFLILAFLGF